MKLTVVRKELSRALSLAARALPPVSSIPILTCFHLATDGGRLAVSANNLETAITVWVSARVEVDGSAALPGRTFADLVGSLAGETVSLTEDKRAVSVVCGANKSRVKGLDPADWPPAPAEAGEGDLTLDASTLKMALRQTAYAMARDDTRPILTGMLFRVSQGALTLAAADGYRLALSNIPAAENPSAFGGVVSGRAINELLRLLGDEGEVRLSIGRTFVARGSDWTLMGRLVEGNFPNYQTLIPLTHKTRATVHRDELLRAIKAMRVVARDSNELVKLALGDGSMELSVVASDVGEASEMLGITREGEPMQSAYNGKLLAECVAAMPTELVTLDLTSPSSPGVIRPVVDIGEPCLAVLMPMCLSGGR